MRGGLCIGGLTSDAVNVRLVSPEGPHRDDSPFQVGSIWDMELTPVLVTQPPHVEDHVISRCRQVGQVQRPGRLILGRVRPWQGGPEVLFDGALRCRPSGRAYVGSDHIPAGSVGFWIPDRRLQLMRTGERARYEYRTSSGTAAVFGYVGCEEPAPTIPAGSLVRVSLARWWRPPDQPEANEVCYAQVSGWFPDS